MLQYNGYIIATANGVCESWVLLPGMSLYHPALLTIVYSIALLYCFIGVSAAADKFMGGIEVITDKRYEEVCIYRYISTFAWSQTSARGGVSIYHRYIGI